LSVADDMQNVVVVVSKIDDAPIHGEIKTVTGQAYNIVLLLEFAMDSTQS